MLLEMMESESTVFAKWHFFNLRTLPYLIPDFFLMWYTLLTLLSIDFECYLLVMDPRVENDSSISCCPFMMSILDSETYNPFPMELKVKDWIALDDIGTPYHFFWNEWIHILRTFASKSYKAKLGFLVISCMCMLFLDPHAWFSWCLLCSCYWLLRYLCMDIQGVLKLLCLVSVSFFLSSKEITKFLGTFFRYLFSFFFCHLICVCACVATSKHSYLVHILFIKCIHLYRKFLGLNNFFLSFKAKAKCHNHDFLTKSSFWCLHYYIHYF